MSRRRRIALGLAGVVLAGGAVVAVLARVATSRADRLLAAAGRRLGYPIEAEGVRLRLLGEIGVTLSGVRVAADPAFGSGEPLLAARLVDMRLRMLPLLQRRLVIDRVVVEEPVVGLARNAAGRLNIESLGTTGAVADRPPEPRSSGAGAPTFELASLRLRHGTIRYRELATGRTLVLEEVAAETREPRLGAPMPLTLRARLAAGAVSLENIRNEGLLDLAPGHPTFRGRIDAGPGAVGGIPLLRLGGAVTASPPALALDEGTLDVLGGTVKGALRLSGGGEETGFSLRFRGADLDLAQIPMARRRPHAAGRLALEGDVAGPTPGAPTFLNELRGSGRFEINDGRLAGIALGRTVREVLGPLLGTEAMGRLGERYPDLMNGDELRFARLAGSGRLGEGRLRTEDLAVVSASYEARGTGSVGLDGSLDLTLRLIASPALTDDLLGHSRARPALVDAAGRLSVPLRVQGSLRHARVSPDPEFTAAVARRLLGGTDLGEAAGSVLQHLLGGKRRRGR